MTKYYDKTTKYHDISTVLDPRFKLEYFKTKKFDKNFITALKTALTEIHDAYELELEQFSAESTPRTVVPKNKNDYIFDFSVPCKVVCEIEIYLFESVEKFDMEPLEYWRKNAFRFKVLSRMARDFLAIPATSVPVEQILSQAGDLITKKRNRLLPKSIKEIMCLNSWLKLDFIKNN